MSEIPQHIKSFVERWPTRRAPMCYILVQCSGVHRCKFCGGTGKIGASQFFSCNPAQHTPTEDCLGTHPVVITWPPSPFDGSVYMTLRWDNNVQIKFDTELATHDFQLLGVRWSDWEAVQPDSTGKYRVRGDWEWVFEFGDDPVFVPFSDKKNRPFTSYFNLLQQVEKGYENELQSLSHEALS